MGQLTNQYVSQSYQGLLNLDNAFTGVTSTLQYVTDGIGNKIPMQVSTSSIVITGSFRGDGSGLTGITATNAISASYANFAVSSSYASTALSSSFATNALSSSYSTNALSSSYATNALSSSYALNATNATNAATASIANDLIVRGKNNNPSQLTRGTIVRISGADGDNPLFDTASWINDANSANTLGMLSEDVASNGFANVVVQGKVSGINTNGMTAGALLFLSSSGQYTTTPPPAPFHEVRLGQVLRVNTNNGSAYISVDNGYELTELHDVDITNPVVGDLLVYRSGSYGQWVNETGAELGFASTGSNVFKGNQTISGSLNVTGSINALSASITYLQTVYQTSSVIFTSGSNILGDEASDVQTLNGRVDIPLGNLNVTGATTSSLGFFGNLQGTASYATNALSASQAQNAVSSSQSQNTVSSSWADNAGLLDGKDSSEFATTGSNTFTGQQNIETNLNVTQSLIVGGNSTFNQQTNYNGNVNYNADSFIKSGSQINFNIGDGLDGAYYRLSKKVGGEFGIVQDPGNNHLLDISTGSATILPPTTFLSGVTVDGTLLLNTGSVLRLNGNNTIGGNVAAIQFQSGSQGTRWINMQPVPGGGGDVAISDFPTNNHFMYYRMGTHEVEFEAPLRSTGSADIEVRNGMIINSNYSPVLAVQERGLTNSGSMVVRGNLHNISNNTTLNPDLYLTSSLLGQSNIILGWGENPSAAGVASNQANYTGSLRITGSNNIVTLPIIRPTVFGFNTEATAYISGSSNIFTANNGTIYLNGGSQLFPKTQGNFHSTNANTYLNFTTSSIAGGHPLINNNLVFGGQIDINHPSGTVNVLTNAILGGGYTSTQTFVTNTRPTIGANNVIGSITLNHISSSINYQNNYNNSPISINNHLSSSGIATNAFNFTNNAVFGGSGNTPLGVWVSGSQSSNTGRVVSDSLIGGRNIIISSSFVSSSNANTIATVIYGNALSVSGSHTTGTNGGSAFFGRFNATGSLQESTQDTIFVVGSGTAVGARRNAIRIDNNSNTTITGSLSVSGSSRLVGDTTITGSLTLSGSINPELIVIGDTVMSGSLSVSGSSNFRGGNVNISGSNLRTNNFIIFDGSPNEAGAMNNFVALQMNNRDIFGFNNILQSQLTSGSNFNLSTQGGINYTNINFKSAYGGTEASLNIENGNGVRSIDFKTDTMKITGSLTVTGSLISTGSIEIASNSGDFYIYGHKMFNTAEFWSTQTQSGSAGVSGSIIFNNSGSLHGVSLVNGTDITVANAGTYNIQFSAQIETSAGADTAYVWYKKNGTNIADSATKVSLANNTAQVMTVNIIDEASANDYYNLGYQFTNGNATILAETASGNIPAIPSVIATVTQVR